jgi:hypothetical protein
MEELWFTRARAVRDAIEDMPVLMDRYTYARDRLNEWRGVVMRYAGDTSPKNATYAMQAQRTFEEIAKIVVEIRNQIIDERGGHFHEIQGHVHEVHNPPQD